MDRRLRYGLIGAAGLMALVIAVPVLLPASVYKGEIERSITGATGRHFAIYGPVHFTLFPMLGLRADKVALANMQGASASAMATADDVRIVVRFWPLLSGSFEVSQIVLDRPDITLEVDKQGHANWIFEQERQPAKGARTPSLPITEHFSELSIVHGRVTYENLHSGHRREIEDLNAKINLDEFDRPATIDGALTLSAERVAFHAKVAIPRRIFQGRAVALDISITSNVLHGSFGGTIGPDGHVAGNIKIDTRSVRRMAAWLGASLSDRGEFGTLSLQSRIMGDTSTAGLSEMKATFDGMKIAGDVALAIDRKVPFARGALSVDHLDIDPYLEQAPKHGVARLHRRGDGWSRDPLSLDLLKKVDALVRVNAGEVTLGTLKLGRTSINLSLIDAQLSASLSPVALYGGSGKVTLDVDARGVASAFRSALQFDNVALQPFLADTIGVKQIEGTGSIILDVESHGENTDAIMRGINGNGSIAFRNGRLRGVDLGAVAQTIQSLLGKAINPEAFTQYKTMDGSFSVARGVLTNRDFALQGPLLSMTGSGDVDVGNRAIDFRIAPKATASIAHQKLTIGVPFRIKGPWRHVHYTADIAGIIKGVFENLDTGRAPFQGLIDDSPKSDAGKKKHKTVGDALKNMLGIH